MKTFFRHWIDKQIRYNPYFYQTLKAVQKERNLSVTETQDRRNELFLKLIQRAYQRSSFYKDLYNRCGVHLQQIQTVEDIDKLPIITKADLLAHIDSMFIGKRINRRKAYTSGTSGKPLQVYRDYQSTIREGAYQWRQRIEFGHYPGMKTIVLRGNLHRGQREYYDPFTQSLYLSSYQISEENASWYYDKVRQFAPQAIYAYPSAVESLANAFSRIGKTVSIPLVFTSSETLYGCQRSKIEKILNTRIVDWYGNAERSIALEENDCGWYSELPLYSVNEYYDNHTVTTGLINFSLPIIRYRVDDVITPASGPVGSIGLRRVEAIQGRSDDILLLPDGSRLGMLWGIFDRVPNIFRVQIIQEELSCFRINLVVSADFGEQDTNLLRSKVTQFVGQQAQYTVSYVTEDDIIRSPSGKYKLVVNKLLSKSNRVAQPLTV